MEFRKFGSGHREFYLRIEDDRPAYRIIPGDVVYINHGVYVLTKNNRLVRGDRDESPIGTARFIEDVIMDKGWKVERPE